MVKKASYQESIDVLKEMDKAMEYARVFGILAPTAYGFSLKESIADIEYYVKELEAIHAE